MSAIQSASVGTVVVRVRLRDLPEACVDMPDQWWSVKRVADYFGISQGVVRHWADAGLIRSRRVSNRREVALRDVAPFASVQAAYGRRAARVIRPPDRDHAYLSLSSERVRRFLGLDGPEALTRFRELVCGEDIADAESRADVATAAAQ